MPAIADVFLRIRVDSGTVKRDVEEGVRQVRTPKMSVPIDADTKPANTKVEELRRNVTALGSRIAKFTLDANDKAGRAKLLEIDAAISRLGARVARPGVDPRLVESSYLKASIALDKLSEDRTVNVKVDVDRSALSRLRGLLGGGGGGGAGLGIGSLIAGGAALSPALLAAGGAAGILGGGLGLGALGTKSLVSGKAVTPQQTAAVASAQARLAAAKTPAQKQAASRSLASAQSSVDQTKDAQGPLFAQGQAVAKAFSASWAQAVQGMAPALKKALVGLPQLFRQIEPALHSVFQGVGALIQPLVTGLGIMAKTLLPLFWQALRVVAPFMLPLLNGFTSLVAGIFPGLIALLKLAGPAVAAFGSVLGILGRALGSILSGLGPGIKAASVLLGAVARVIGTLAPVVALLAVKLAVALAPAFVAIARGLVALTPSLLKLVNLLGPVLVGAVNLAVIGLTAIIGAFVRLPAPLKLAALAIIAVGLALKLAAAANPWVLLITATIIAVGLIVRYWKPISGFFVGIWHTIHDNFVAPIVNFFTKTIPNAFGAAIGAIRRTLGTWAPILATLLLGPLAGAVVFIVTHWNTVKNITLAVFGAIGRFFASWWGATTRFFSAAVNAVARALSVAWNAVKGVTLGVFNAIGSFFSRWWGDTSRFFTASVHAVGRVLSDTWNAIKAFALSVFGAIGGFFAHWWGSTTSFFTTSVHAVGKVLGDTWTAIKTTVSSVFGDIGRFFSKWWGDTVNFITGKVNTIHDVVAKVWDTISKNTKKLWNDIGAFMGAGIKAGQAALGATVNFVTQDILNPLVKGYNLINNIWSGKDVGLIPRLATGGKITQGTHETADDVLIRVSRGETVLSAAHSRVLEKAGVLGELGVPGFATGGQILTDATKYNHHRYVWGGPANPKQGWDCSSFVGYILGHDFSYPLPGGVHWNGSVHGPTANEFVRQPGFHMVSHNTKDILPGDLLVENSGGHVGFGVGPNQMFSAYDTAMGTVFTNAANMTNILRSTGGAGVYTGPGGTISAAQQKAYNAYIKLLDKDIKLYSPTAIARAFEKNPGPIPKGVLTGKGLAQYNATGGNAATAIKPTVVAKFNAAVAALAAAAGPGGNPAGVGGSAGEMANGRQLYQYLLKNLFGGHKIAAAGAIASIWGESTWNPFAQGTGGRGLIGWTPPGTISNADFRGGMKTQLPAILRFVTRSGDSGVIAQMFNAGSVLQAANLWGRGVERFGINDVHSTGLQLAKQIAGLKNGGRVSKFGRGGMIHEPMIGMGASGQQYLMGENGRERVVPADGDPLVARMDRLIALMERAPGRTAAGVAAAVNAPAAGAAQAARAGAR